MHILEGWVATVPLDKLKSRGLTSMQKKYEPIDDITQRLFGYSPNATTKNRWVHGKRSDGRKLPAIKLNNRLQATEEDVIAFLTVETEESAKPASQPKTRSEKARAKAIAEANKELETAGI